MKILKMNAIITMVIIGMLHSACVLEAKSLKNTYELSTTLAAYRNKISDISYTLGTNDQHIVTISFQSRPIYIYTPLSCEDSSEASLTKTYFLPHTKSTTAQMHYINEDVRNALKILGIDVSIQKIIHPKNDGLQINFMMQTDSAYKIVKRIDTDKKTIEFEIVANSLS